MICMAVDWVAGGWMDALRPGLKWEPKIEQKKRKGERGKKGE